MKTVTMTIEDFNKEHKKLVKILVKGTPAERKKEAADQKREWQSKKKK